MKLLWNARPTNRKTGPIPTGWIGETREESRKSCSGCALLSSGQCYAWSGTPAMGLAGIQRAAAAGQDRTIESALANRHPSAKAIRFGAIGDPAAVAKSELRRVAKLARRAGLATIGYTHHWRKARHASLKSLLMASADTLAQADDAISAGWIPAAVVPETVTSAPLTPNGNRLMICPAIRSKGATTCNDCRLCDPSNPYWTKQSRYSGIAFPDHGPAARARSRKEIR